MKGSRVVQGIKAYVVSKLHPQLPLTQKESQRLLTALTTSFRKQLAESHPAPASGDESRPQLGGTSGQRPGTHELHFSSASFADKHLASVLTNPLLAKRDGPKKPVLDYASAKIELQKTVGKDPMSLLEEYQEEGCATVPIAILCLEKFHESLEGLTPERRRAVISETEAGRRGLIWLWKNKLHESDAFVDDHRFRNMMVPLIILEGHEEFLWEWLELDIQLGTQESPHSEHSTPRNMRYRYRWRGRLLRDIIVAKLSQDPLKSANLAIETFERAVRFKVEATKTGTGSHWPINTGGLALQQALLRDPVLRRNTDVALYEMFMRSTYWRDDANRLLSDLTYAEMRAHHPTKPVPFEALRLLRAIFRSDLSLDAKAARRFFAIDDDTDCKHAQKLYNIMLATAATLYETERSQDADWVVAHIRSTFPQHERRIEGDIRNKLSDRPGHDTQGLDARKGPSERLPMPSLG